MMTRVTKVLIGKYLSRTSSLVLGGSSENIAEGEIAVLDKNKKLLSAGATVEDTDAIYLVQALGTTMTYSNTAGTSFTVKNLKFSDPIEGKLVKGYRGVAFDPKVEQSTSFAAITSPLTIGTEWVLRVVYKDIYEKRGQFTKTYRFIATATTSANVYNGLRAAIRKDAGARVTVNADDTAALVLTGKAIPSCTTALTDLNKFSMVVFDAYLTYINSSKLHAAPAGGGTKTTVKTEWGSGNWEQVRDAEKGEWGYEGITNRIAYPVILPAQNTVKSTEYDCIVIEHDRSYLSPDNQYVKRAPMTTLLYMPTNAGQTADVLGVLNPWMASVGFTSVTF